MSCVLYRHYCESGQLLYVGISSNIARRNKAHKNSSGWFSEVSTIKLCHFEKRVDAEREEIAVIDKENPKWNALRPNPIFEGKRFDGLTALKRVKNTPNGQKQWLMLCDCGNERVVVVSRLGSEVHACKECSRGTGGWAKNFHKRIQKIHLEAKHDNH